MPSSVSKIFIIIVVSLGLASVGAALYITLFNNKADFDLLPKIDIQVAGIHFAVEKADTKETRMQGLSGRDSLETGMLFMFDNPGLHAFWMKEMNFPIDIIWFDYTGKVIEVTLGAKPEGKEPTKLYKPKTEVKYVLEVPAGWALAHSVEGDYLEFCKNDVCERIEQVEQEENVVLRDLPVEDENFIQEEPEIPDRVVYNVPFAAQAPFGRWGDPRQQDGCEEAAIIMASRWLTGEDMDERDMLNEIFALVDYQKSEFGYFEDTSAQDTAKLLNSYYKVDVARVSFDVTIKSIKQALASNSLVITPMDGRGLNPYFTPPGPARHMVLIIGYDDATGEFITNDPGTRRGESFRYKYETFLNAIRDYPSGRRVPMQEETKAMVVVGKTN